MSIPMSTGSGHGYEQLIQNEKKLEEIDARVKRNATQGESLQSGIEELDNKLNALSPQINTVLKRSEEARALAERAKTSSDTLEQEIPAVATRLSELKSQVLTNQGLLGEASSATGEITGQLKQLQKEVSNLQEAVDKLSQSESLSKPISKPVSVFEPKDLSQTKKPVGPLRPRFTPSDAELQYLNNVLNKSSILDFPFAGVQLPLGFGGGDLGESNYDGTKTFINRVAQDPDGYKLLNSFAKSLEKDGGTGGLMMIDSEKIKKFTPFAAALYSPKTNIAYFTRGDENYLEHELVHAATDSKYSEKNGRNVSIQGIAQDIQTALTSGLTDDDLIEEITAKAVWKKIQLTTINGYSDEEAWQVVKKELPSFVKDVLSFQPYTSELKLDSTDIIAKLEAIGIKLPYSKDEIIQVARDYANANNITLLA